MPWPCARSPYNSRPCSRSSGTRPSRNPVISSLEKAIPDSAEKMRIEFMAPEEYKREKDFRVDIQEGVHARACTGGSIALAQSDLHTISGKLPSGTPCTAQVRVTQPQALVMLKLLALADRYNNIRGTKEARHDREEAQTHAADTVAIVRAVPDIRKFNDKPRLCDNLSRIAGKTSCMNRLSKSG